MAWAVRSVMLAGRRRCPGSGPWGRGRSPRVRARGRSGASSCRRARRERLTPDNYISSRDNLREQKNTELFLTCLLTGSDLFADPGRGLGPGHSAGSGTYDKASEAGWIFSGSKLSRAAHANYTGPNRVVQRRCVSARRRPRWRSQEVTHMPEDRFAVQVVGGMPVVRRPRKSTSAMPNGCGQLCSKHPRMDAARWVVDMSGTQFCDSSGIHVLVRAHKRAQAEFGELLLVLPSQQPLARLRDHRH